MSLRMIAMTATLVAGGMVGLHPAAAAVPAAAAAPTARSGSLCAPPADTVGPVATSVRFGRSTIDLDSGSRRQTVTVHASDTSGDGAASGVGQVRILLRIGRFFDEPRLRLVSGTPASGVWRGSVLVSKYAHPGRSTILELDLIDRAGNEQDYPGTNFDGKSTVAAGPDALSLHPELDPSFSIIGTPATRPTGKPSGTLHTFTITPGHVNTTASGRAVHVTARFAGRAPSGVVVNLAGGASKHERFVYLHARLHQHGRVWRGRIHVGRWLGKQKLEANLQATFPAGSAPRSRNYDTQRLHHLHLTSRVAVVSGVDHTKPRLTSVSLSPDPIDSTSGPERVTVTARATDTGSGVRSVFIDGGIRHGINGVAGGSYPLGAAGIGFDSSQDFQVLLHKTARGTWVGTTTVPRCVPSGTYKLTAYLTDKARNVRGYSTKKLAQAHLTSTVDVTSKHGDVEAPYVYSAATYSADSELFVNFSEGVRNVNTSTVSVYPLAPRRTRYRSPATVSTIVCSDGHMTVDCSGASGLVTSAILTVPDMTSGKLYAVYGNLDQVVPQLTDGNRNPLDWNIAQVEVRAS